MKHTTHIPDVDEYIIGKAYESAMIKLWDVYWQSWMLESNHDRANDAFTKGVLSARSARDHAVVLLRKCPQHSVTIPDQRDVKSKH